jgi:hypothetical protein
MSTCQSNLRCKHLLYCNNRISSGHSQKRSTKGISTYTPPTTDPAIKASIPPTSPKMIGVTQMSFQFLHWISIAYMAAMRWMPMTSISVHSRMKRKMVEAS